MDTPWLHRFAKRTERMGSSAIRELLKLAGAPGIISFGGGLPAPEIFPIDAFNKACDTTLNDHGAEALQYSTTEGYLPLREMIARHSARYGIKITTDNILITSGSQQALDLLGKILINPGDHVLVEEPTYLGAIQAWNAYEAKFITVETDEYGMVIPALEEALRSGPKFIYSLPNFQNPTGLSYSLERREKVVELANAYGVPIIEDDPYGQLRFEGEHLPSLVFLDGVIHENGDDFYTGNVIYLSTFSKTLAPGLRLAWVIAPPIVINRLVQAKQGADLQTATFNQIVAHEVAKEGFLDRHVQVIRTVYKERRDVMLESLKLYCPPGVQWTHPSGGLFLWVTVPKGISTAEVLVEAIKQKVAFVPGGPFYPNGGGENTMRLNFSNASPENIRIGIERLGKVLYDFIGDAE